ncbi:MAG: hypothetical protein PHT19_11080 [Methylococcus sp.]|nr:hypothetical protein [Methylococcus sp.]
MKKPSYLQPPMAATHQAVANHVLGVYPNGMKTSVLDLLYTVLDRARGMAGVIGGAAWDSDKNGVTPQDIHEAAFAVRAEIETALLLLKGLEGEA